MSRWAGAGLLTGEAEKQPQALLTSWALWADQWPLQPRPPYLHKVREKSQAPPTSSRPPSVSLHSNTRGGGGGDSSETPEEVSKHTPGSSWLVSDWTTSCLEDLR